MPTKIMLKFSDLKGLNPGQETYVNWNSSEGYKWS